MKKLFENFRKYINEDEDIKNYIKKYSSQPTKANPLDPNAKPNFKESDIYDGSSNFPLQLWNACAEEGNKDRKGSPEYSPSEILFAVREFLIKNDMTGQQLELEYNKVEAYVSSMSDNPERLKDIEGARKVFEAVVYDALGGKTPGKPEDMPSIEQFDQAEKDFKAKK